MEELRERLGRYSRLLENDDFVKTLKEMEAEYNLNGSVFSTFNCPNATEFVMAREGMRTLVNRFRGLVDETQAIIEQEENQGEIDE